MILSEIFEQHLSYRRKPVKRHHHRLGSGRGPEAKGGLTPPGPTPIAQTCYTAALRDHPPHIVPREGAVRGV